MAIKQSACVLFAVFAAAGCRAPDSPVDSAKVERQRECVMVGNDPARLLCAVTYVQLLAYPERYDQKRIKMLAWAQPSDSKRVVLFPSADSLQNAELIAAVVVDDAQQVPGIQRHLTAGNPEGAPRPIYIAGTFSLASEPTRHSDGIGTLRSIEFFGAGP
ncbi:hypothetical protein [Lysobacter arvi]|uniref:Uncharacterized protein n=1 Tax=Lysobacter arvi TaxID=3038776 RepID=A0ABU1CES2_9GAMM|nr:hypothetical protein [Lysobacter arvi]MDR0183230.1 hypothetical protein [Lysobacter arvi]